MVCKLLMSFKIPIFCHIRQLYFTALTDEEAVLSVGNDLLQRASSLLFDRTVETLLVLGRTLILGCLTNWNSVYIVNLGSASDFSVLFSCFSVFIL
jgi:hypothetical protein